MAQPMLSRFDDRVLQGVSLLTLAAVTLFELQVMHQEGVNWYPAAGLATVFGLYLFFIPGEAVPSWRHHLYLTVQTVLVIGLLALTPDRIGFGVLFFVLSPIAMLLLPARLGLLWISAFTLVMGVALVRSLGWPEGLVPLPAYTAAYFFFGIFAQALTRAETSRKQSQALLEDLEAAHRQLHQYATRVEELAVAEERNRLAREMHDTLGHRLTVSAVQLEGAQRLIPQDPQRAAAMIDTARDQVREALSELRRTVATLRAPIEEDLQLRRSLRRLAAHFEEATGTTVHLMLPEERPDLPDVYRLALYRAAQEALTNVQRHARAKDVWLQLAQQDGRVVLLVADNGAGLRMGDPSSGFGLRGLRERAIQLEGECYVEPRPGGGAQLSFRLPLPVGQRDD